MSGLRTFTVDSLNDYISIIKENRLTEYYLRGENSKYPSISSSLLRKDTSVLLQKESYNFYENIVNNYYEEIATNINEFDRTNFLAFSQHHGLATNLIDLTTSPLVALYFACAKNNINQANNIGYVYLIEKEKTIDVSRLLKDCFSPPANSYNLIEMFRCGDAKTIETFVSCLNKYFWNHGFEPYKTNVLNQCCELDKSTGGIFQVFLHEYIKVIKNPEVMSNPDLFYDLLFKESSHNIQLKLGSCSNNLAIYLNLLKEYFNTLTSISFLNEVNIKIEFPHMPYFIYKTPYKFDRIRNQEGLFLYQLFHTYATTHEDKPDSIIKQDIIPDITIIINDQINILEELDFIGINSKNIYGDYDTIAKYLNNKHF